MMSLENMHILAVIFITVALIASRYWVSRNKLKKDRCTKPIDPKTLAEEPAKNESAIVTASASTPASPIYNNYNFCTNINIYSDPEEIAEEIHDIIEDCDCNDNCHCGHGPHCGHCGHDPHCGHCGHCPDNNEFDAWIGDWYFIKENLCSCQRRIVASEICNQICCTKPSAASPVAALSVPVNENRIRIAFISVYGISCGIATYNEALLAELRLYADVKVFAEYADKSHEERLPTDPMWVTRCWDRKEHPKTALVTAVKEFAPDLIHFSHEYGLFHPAYMFTGLVSQLKSATGAKVLTTFHSVYDHLDKTVCEAVSDHIMVHTDEARVVLIKKGIDSRIISVIPHGTHILAGSPENPGLKEKLWNTWEAPTIFQPGFLFDYKGHMRMLDVVSELRTKYPDIQYIIQGSENSKTQHEHDVLAAQIETKIRDLKLEGNVTMRRGFISKEALMSYILTARMVVLPYNNHPDHDVRATSGIARLVMATEVPMVVSRVHLFDDLEGYVPRASDVSDLVKEIDNLLTDWKAVNMQIANRIGFLRKTSWASVASRINALYKSLI